MVTDSAYDASQRSLLDDLELKNIKLLAVIPAAGSGERLGLGISKALADIHGESILTRTVSKFISAGVFSRIIVTAPEERPSIFNESLSRVEALLREEPPLCRLSKLSGSKLRCVPDDKIELIAGGATRSDSVRKAIRALAGEAGEQSLVVLHDAARIFVSDDLLMRCIAAAHRSGAATAAIPVVDTLRLASTQNEVKQLGAVVSRDRLWAMQTPQVFKLSLLRQAFDAQENGVLPAIIKSDDPELRSQIAPGEEPLYTTDEVGLVQRLCPVEFVQGSPINFKITTKEDLELARLIWRVE